RRQEWGSLGLPMRELAETRGASVDPRFRQLLAADRNSLPYYLRQAVRLLHTANAIIDYDRLLDDLVTVLGRRSSDEDGRRVRLEWAREYHYRPTEKRPTSTAADTSLT
ncbi:type I-E CRISPR-associated protein Cse2/CasB, partial [Amycolatopsis rhizosphaerae]